MVFLYLVETLAVSLFNFLYHWYVAGFFRWLNILIDVFRELDKILAVKINALYWFKPFYQDYTTVGLILSFIFRTIRITGGLVLYLAIFVLFLAGLLAWFGILPFIVYKIFNPF